MFYGQCFSCGERWELGTTSTCKCPELPDYKFDMKNAPIKYKLGKAVSTDWVMRITADRKIEVAADVDVTEAAKKVLEAMQLLLDAKPANGIIEIKPIGHHSLQLVFDSQDSIQKFISAYGEKKPNPINPLIQEFEEDLREHPEVDKSAW